MFADFLLSIFKIDLTAVSLDFIDELEEELEWYCRNASDEEEHIIHLENSLDKLYRKLELLEKL